MSAHSWIDVHTHLNMLDIEPELALAEASARGVDRMITIGTNPQDWPLVLSLAERHGPEVFCTLGLHPHDARLWTPEAQTYLRQNLTHPRVVAVGEIGLDYFYDNSPREVQKVAFREQMELAAKLRMPVEIHTRDAEADTLVILKEFAGRVTGILHCFTGTWELAEPALALGYHLSFSGVVTFKNAEALREVCRKTPVDAMHIETDAPFLAPVPHRGKKNRPAMVVDTAQVVAQTKNMSLEELCYHTTQNAKRMFPKLHTSPVAQAPNQV